MRTLLVLLSGAVAGLVATKVKVTAEGLIQPRAEGVWPLTPEQRLIPGADAAGHGELMPPTVVVKRVAALVGRPIPDGEDVEKYAAPLHWSTGAGAGVVYAALRRAVPGAGAGLGVPAGLGLYALTHASTLPAFGIQPPPWRTPPAAVVWEGGSHAVFGVALDLQLRLLDLVFRRR